MIIHRKPYAAIPGSADQLILSRQDDVLTINGDTLDLSVLGEGSKIKDAGTLHPMLRDTIHRTDGVLHITVRQPFFTSTGHVDDPDPIIDPPNGPIEIAPIDPPEPEPEEIEEEEPTDGGN